MEEKSGKLNWHNFFPNQFLLISLVILLFGLSFYIFYNQTQDLARFLSDLPSHIAFTDELFSGENPPPLIIFYPLFHTSVFLFSIITSLSLTYSAIGVLSLSKVITFLIIYSTFKSILKEKYREYVYLIF